MLIVRFLLDNGVGQNLTAGVIVFALGWCWSRTKFWPLHALHVRHDRLAASHERLHQTLARIEQQLSSEHPQRPPGP